MIFIRLDENVSPKLGEFASVLLRVRQDVVFESPHSLGERGVQDTDWMKILAGRGAKKGALRIAFSGDSFTDPERAAAEELRITLFYTPRMYWRPLRSIGQAAYFLRWLPSILEMAESNPPGSQFRLPGHFSPRADVKPLPSITGRRTVRPGRPRRPKSRPAAPLLEGVE